MREVTTMSDTTTEAGRTLLEDDLCDCVGDEISHDLRCRSVSLAPAIAAIERQAAAAARAEIAEQVDAKHVAYLADSKRTTTINGQRAAWNAAIDAAFAIIEGKGAT